MFATTSLRPLMTAVDPRMNWMGAFFPSAWVASKIYYQGKIKGKIRQESE
jgi:hypothetical protein